jgi:hypothetical protein
MTQTREWNKLVCPPTTECHNVRFFTAFISYSRSSVTRFTPWVYSRLPRFYSQLINLSWHLQRVCECVLLPCPWHLSCVSICATPQCSTAVILNITSQRTLICTVSNNYSAKQRNLFRKKHWWERGLEQMQNMKGSRKFCLMRFIAIHR